MIIGTIGGTKITILNLYAPNEDCPYFFKKIAGLVADKGEGIILMGEDFNWILNTKLSKSLSSMMTEAITHARQSKPINKMKRKTGRQGTYIE